MMEPNYKFAGASTGKGIGVKSCNNIFAALQDLIIRTTVTGFDHDKDVGRRTRI